jgi:hypothetical protein
VADRLALIDDPLVRLVVLAASPLRAVRAALVKEEPREREIAIVAGDAVELDEAISVIWCPGQIDRFPGPNVRSSRSAVRRATSSRVLLPVAW